MRTGMRDRCIAGIATDKALQLLLSLSSSKAPIGSGSTSIGESAWLCAGVFPLYVERLLRRWFSVVLVGRTVFHWSGAHQPDTKVHHVARLLLRCVETTFVVPTASSSWSFLSPFIRL